MTSMSTVARSACRGVDPRVPQALPRICPLQVFHHVHPCFFTSVFSNFFNGIKYYLSSSPSVSHRAGFRFIQTTAFAEVLGRHVFYLSDIKQMFGC